MAPTDETPVVCGRCGGRLPVTARFCGYCGTAVPGAQPLLPPPGASAAFVESGEAAVTFSKLAAPRWRVVLPGGTIVPIDGPLLIGRRPDAAMGPRGARLLTVEDAERTVSRSHLVLAPSAGGIMAIDVSGHSGIVITAFDGSERRVTGEAIELVGSCRIGLGRVSVWLEPT